jgi:hypothetical protein
LRVGEAIWALWYDIAEDRRADYCDWLHVDYLPCLLAKPGFAWAAHYRITGGGARMNDIGTLLARPEVDEVPSGRQFVLLVGASGLDVFFQPRIDTVETSEPEPMLRSRRNARAAIFIEQAYVAGPETAMRPKGGCPGPAIQMGSFRTKTVADEWDLAAWYVQYRLPAISAMPGCIGARKLVSVAGWAKHAVLYEFTSLQARQEAFQPHESLALDEKVWTNRIINYTVHSPGSPHIGARIWPPDNGGATL